MPTVTQIRNAIATRMRAVPNVGQVYDYQRYDKNIEALQALYRSTIGGVDQVRSWFIWRFATDRQSPQLGRYVITHTWRIRGYQSLSDAVASEKTFDDLIETMAAGFRDDESLGGVVASTVTERAAGLQLDEQAPVMFAGVLCHMASMTLYTRHYE